MSIRSGVRSALVSGVQSGLDPGTAAPVWSTDATSSKGVPVDATEWGSLISSNSLAVAVPDYLWLCQEASGNLADTIGGKTLTAGGSPGYQQTITGWTRTAVGQTGAAGNQTFLNVTMPNINAASAMFLLYAKITTPVTGGQRTCFGGSSNNAWEGVSASGVMRLRTGGTAGNGASDHSGQVRPFVVVLDRTNSFNAIFSDIETRAITYGAPASGTTFQIQVGTLADATNNTQVLYAAAWTGANAEKNAAAVKAMLQALGWTVTGY